MLYCYCVAPNPKAAEDIAVPPLVDITPPKSSAELFVDMSKVRFFGNSITINLGDDNQFALVVNGGVYFYE